MSFFGVISIASILIASLMLYTLVILVTRIYLSSYRKKKHDTFSEALTLEICDFIDGTPPPFKVRRPGRFERKIIQEQLLDTIRSMNGRERAYLINRYKKMGFMEEDLAACTSYRWGKRLRAIVHLGYLEQNELAPLFLNMIGDRASIVATAATLALTALDHPLNDASLLEKLPDTIFERKDVLSEVMSRISEKHSQVVLDRITDPKSNPLLKESCIRAILRERSFGVVPTLADFLDQNALELNSPNNSNIALVISGLQSIGDPGACVSVRRFAKHPLPKIRALALQMLFQLGDPDTLAAIPDMKNDSSIEVQRVILMRAA